MKKTKTCPKCKGKGEYRHHTDGLLTCRYCGGTGKLQSTKQTKPNKQL